MSILTGNEAFAAMAAGQSIECRHKDATVFDAIRNFPATVFFDADHEFRIAIVFMAIGEMQVAEAVKEAPAKGIQCFTPSLLTEELSKGFKWKNSANDLVLLNRGLVHLVQEHAETHAKALIAVSGGSAEVSETIDKSEWPASQVPSQNFIDMWLSRSQDEPTRKNLASMKASMDHNWDQLDQDYQLQARKIYSDFEALVEHAENEVNEAEPVNEIEQVLGPIANKPDNELTVANLQKLQQEAELLCSKPAEESAEDKYQALLNDLVGRAAVAATPAEANALVGYTKEWTAEQRKPLLTAISKRLMWLSPKPEIEQPPSLMVQIQNAPDLTTLDALEIDVSARAPEIQPKLMDYVKKRRFELENAPDAVAS
ncbi:hypothetical protein HXZ60_01995 [Acinetobacter towneri]|uniref:hypothetical protein n=1 Tax=Acinetobacter towneri TaxID=202956 RepID=UPI00257692B9|nr:hypothetical protein [Acinetobacter towneri]MDM1282372.1 hypothetical protein [Acinetobacter towneri]